MDAKEFTGQYPLSKTLRFELRPIGRTWDNLEASGYLAEDRHRAECYPRAKELLDDNHRAFLNRVLPQIDMDWHPIAEAFCKVHKNPGNKELAQDYNLQLSKRRKEISDYLQDADGYKGLFAKPALDEAMKIAKENGNESDIEVLEAFNGFSVYFTGYHESRENIYSDEDMVSVAYRITEDNFPRFVSNALIFDKLNESHPDIISEVSGNLGVDDIGKYFDVSNYNNFLSQAGIDDYNHIIGGHTTEDGLIQAFNVVLNLRHQKDPGFEKIQFKQLYKQILSVRTSKSYIPKQFDNSKEMVDCICDYVSKIEKSGTVERALKLVRNISSFDLRGIFVNKKNLRILSNKLIGDWDAIETALMHSSSSENDKKSVYDSAEAFTLYDIFSSVKKFSDASAEDIGNRAEDICRVISETAPFINDLRAVDLDSLNDDGYEAAVSKIRESLEPYMDLFHELEIFSVGDEFPKCAAFYSELEEVSEQLIEIIPLFNKARSFCTRKRYSTDKIKVNLKFPTLADGWDLNKERDNKAAILRKDGKYYLAILDMKKDLSSIRTSDEDESSFEKMEYKLLPSPVKMLPKIFVKSKAAKEKYGLTDRMLECYDKGMHKSGSAFDLGFCHELIDYYKRCIAEYPGWDVFDFKFRETSDYGSMKEFNEDVAGAGYYMSLRKIPCSEVYRLLDEKSIYLFQIYNKDYSENAHGNKNMHTMYWEGLFSPQNLESPVFKLSGGAELFFRKSSIPNDAKTVHPKGSVLVPRNDVNGRRIPDSIYRELTRYFNRGDCRISDEAKSYLDKVKTKKADHDIVKDRRFTVDKMMFHVPIAMNFKAISKPNLNKKVIDGIIDDQDLKIIGIDRGERNLIYVTMVDRKGNILYQDSLNILNGYDYRKALDVREYDNKEARRNWTKVEGIRKMKEGYLSLAVSKLADMIIENNAIIVMEDLNHGFKAGRSKIEKQVYQKFESMLINKLGYMVLKDKSIDQSGGALHGYQLANHVTTLASVGKQCGVIFYIPAAFTSKIDPTTGFADLFALSNVKNVASMREFFSKMKSVIYDKAEGKFAFTFDYLDYNVKSECGRTLWTVYTVGERFTYSRVNREYVRKVPTDIIYDALQKAGISVEGDLRDRIAESDGDTLKSIFYAFKYALDMRVENREEDYIQSPVKNASGEFFCSKNAGKSLPQDSDANGAYNIALKGILQLRMLSEQYDPNAESIRLPLITNKAWLTFMQSGMKTWKN
ncbi:type V CRISPR-associated protein Cas12a/Cpf1 [Methanomethylophilus alvi]|uniref:type V CRISPR-associated protein Cas12a/Cpf1 n=1 Tax=Methanomethylophilus alvi TaxID=1291540 RepID=UPI0037DD5330